MKRALGWLTLICLLVATLTCTACGLEDSPYLELQSPLFRVYRNMPRARCAYDMILWDGCLHIGAGDYTNNAGPIGMWSYDPATEQWSLNGTTFYIGTGNVHADLEKNGMILVVPYEK